MNIDSYKTKMFELKFEQTRTITYNYEFNIYINENILNCCAEVMEGMNEDKPHLVARISTGEGIKMVDEAFASSISPLDLGKIVHESYARIFTEYDYQYGKAR